MPSTQSKAFVTNTFADLSIDNKKTKEYEFNYVVIIMQYSRPSVIRTPLFSGNDKSVQISELFG